MKLDRQRLMEIAGLSITETHELVATGSFPLKEQTEFTFSGTDRFMDKTAVNVFKKYGIDKAKLNREYDPNEGIVEFTIELDNALADKIESELESADRGRGDYGGYMERAGISENDQYGIEDIANELVDKLKTDTSLSNAGISLEGLNSQQERALNDALLNALMDIGEEYNIVF